ncbi:uncharacterized protein LOC142357029 [Convolutriloba macropyga]|uniref:uncharacterized protein LOC142357029 n=1 Tax=Convolutriloba macropyga TaxID=536237 RepID=UPI003F527B24
MRVRARRVRCHAGTRPNEGPTLQSAVCTAVCTGRFLRAPAKGGQASTTAYKLGKTAPTVGSSEDSWEGRSSSLEVSTLGISGRDPPGQPLGQPLHPGPLTPKPLEMGGRSQAAGLLLVLALAACASSMQPWTAPAFVWGNTNHLKCGRTGETSRVTYEVRAAEFWGGDFIQALLGGKPSSDTSLFVNPEVDSKPEVLTVFLGSKLQTSDLAKLSDTQELRPLQNALSSASSSLSVPHVDFKAGSASLLQSFSAATNAIEGAQLDLVGPCSPESPSPLSKDGLAAAVKGLTANSTHVLLVCADTAGDVTEEMDMFASLTAELDSLERPNMVMYMSQPSPSRPSARVMMEQVQKKCDGECMAFVYAIEAAIILLIVLVAVLLGMTCHNMLDAPSKFEVPKQE